MARHRMPLDGDIVIVTTSYNQYAARIIEVSGETVSAVRQYPRANQYASFEDMQARCEFPVSAITETVVFA